MSGSSPSRPRRHGRASPDALAMLPFDPRADAIVHSERQWPMTVHLELLLADVLERDRFVHALERAMARHPMTTVRRAPFRPWTRSFTWELMSPHADHVVEAAAHGSDLDEARDNWLSRRVPLDIAPPFRVLIVTLQSGGCVLLFHAHHAAFDGLGASVLLRAAFTEYATTQASADHSSLGTPDELSSTPTGTTPNGTRLARATRTFGTRVATVARAVRPIVATPMAARLLAPEPAPVGREYVVVLDRLDLDATTRLRGGRLAQLVPTATLNDLLLAALHHTLGDWTDRQSAGTDLITVTMPVQRRHPGARAARVDNGALQAVTSTRATDRVSAESTLRCITNQTQAIKNDRHVTSPAEALGEVTILPVAVRAEVPRLVSWLTRDRFLDTMRLSNLGPVEMLPTDGVGPEIRGMWFTPPARTPQSLNIGTVQHHGALHLGYRACSGPWTRVQVEAFAEAYRAVLDSYG